MKHKSSAVRRNYWILGLILIIIAIGIGGVIVAGAEAGAAVPAPTATPGIAEPVPQDGHCTLLVDGDTCYVLTLPGCNWVMTKFGQDSLGVTLECDPVKAGDMGEELGVASEDRQ